MRTPIVGINIAVPFSDIYLFLWGTKHLAFWHLAIQRFAVTSSQLNLDFTIKLVSASLSTCSKLHLISFLEFPLKSQSHAALPSSQQGNLFEKMSPFIDKSRPGNILLHSKGRRTTCLEEVISSRLYQVAYLQLHYCKHYNSSVGKTAEYKLVGNRGKHS